MKALGDRRAGALGLSWWLAALVAATGCADALSLGPPVGDGSGGGGHDAGVGAFGGGGGAPIGCRSNSDCPEPTNVCDLVKEICVECLTFDDCSQMPGTVCSQGSCVCPGGDTWCAPDRCVDTSVSSEHCGACDLACFGACAAGSCVDPWRPTPSDGAPSARGRHVAVWSGSSMIVWGGTTTANTSGNLADGALFDPARHEWTPMSSVGAPSPRQGATAIWTGSEMIVWGGRDGNTFLADGAIFDPATNSWSAMSSVNAPEGRFDHTAIWTGSEMIVWGGQNTDVLSSGGRYDRAADLWSATQVVPSPGESRTRHTAVYDETAMRMVLYGGFGTSFIVGSDFWPSSGVPGGRFFYPGAGSWEAVNTSGEPSARDRHTAVWDGTSMLLFGGYNGSTDLDVGFKLFNNTWTAFNGDAPSARREHTAVYLDGPGVMVVWGGTSSTLGHLGDGGVYQPSMNSWTMHVPTALTPRVDHTAVSTGDTMIVWGGFDGANQALASGGIYTP